MKSLRIAIMESRTKYFGAFDHDDDMSDTLMKEEEEDNNKSLFSCSNGEMMTGKQKKTKKMRLLNLKYVSFISSCITIDY